MSLRKRCSQTATGLFFCGTSPRCDHHWHYDFQVHGRRYRNTTDTSDKHKARDIEARERSRVLDGKHGIRRNIDLTFRAFAAEYLKNYAETTKRASTLKRDRQMLGHSLYKHFGALMLHEITQFGIEKFKAARLADGLAPSSVNRELMLLKGMLTIAVEWKKLMVSPAAKVKPLKCRPERTRILTADEQIALLAAYDRGRLKLTKPIIHLLLITGARVGELLNLKWADCGGGYLRLRHTKNGRERTFPMTDAMAAILASVPRRGDQVFVSHRTGKPFQRLLTGFKGARAAAGITDRAVVIHTLRHTAISRMCEAGIDLRTIMEISGHQSLAMLERYSHPSEQRKAAALNTFATVTTASQPASLQLVK